MKSKDVLRILRITRPTLTKYVKVRRIRVETLPNGFYEYNDEDVYKILNKDVKRKTYIYARVSTSKQKADLNNQIEMLKQFCFSNGYTISGVFSDIANSQEIFEEIVSLLCCYSMKMYSKRKIQRVKEVIEDDSD